MHYPRKLKRRIDPIDIAEDMPSFYFASASQIKMEKTGVHRLRARNDRIHAELQDLGSRLKAKVTATKQDDVIWYTVLGEGVSVCLVNQ